MSNTTSALRGLCPAPFFDASKFSLDGFVQGRYCAPVQQGLSCCLPCPATDYLYPKDFKSWYRASEALNLVGLLLMLFLLLSFAVLPAEKSRRHYLSICLIIGAIFMALSFVIPFGARPNQCHDEITPNDMFSDLTCAFSGAFLVAGGLSVGVWIFIRALSMHLQICWDVMPGKRFFYGAQILGWAVAAGFFTATMTVTGVSYRFGELCHVNANESTKAFWGPLLFISGAATLCQVATFVYCIKVYLQNAWSDDKTETQSSAGLPSYTNSVRTRSARAVYRRVRKVLWLQWRGITIVVFILVDVIFFSVVFIYLNSVAAHAVSDLEKALPLILCLMKNAESPEICTDLAQKLFVNKSTVIAILIMLSMAGIQVFVLLVRTSIFTAWFDLFRSRFGQQREFVSLDAKQDHINVDSHQFELSKFAGNPATSVQVPANTYQYPIQADYNPHRRSVASSLDFSSKDEQTERHYQTPAYSFSAPRSPTGRAPRMDFHSMQGRGGLGSHPPMSDDHDIKDKERY